MKVLITSNSFDKYSNVGTEILSDAGFKIIRNKYGRVMTETEFIEELDGADAVILSTEVLNEKVLKTDPNLQVVSRYGVGVDNIDIDYLKKHNIVLERAINCNNQAVADYTVGLIINCCRGIVQSAMAMRNNEWKKWTGIDVCGKTVGIIGLGSIGKEVAKRLSGFGCHLIAFDFFYDDSFCKKWNITKVTLNEIYQQSDIITLHVPANTDGTPLIDAQAISSFKDGVILINTARRSLVDEAFLLKALKNGKVRGYASDAPLSLNDVTEEMNYLDNVIITPHNAAVTFEASQKMSRVSAENVVKYFINR